jgi:uncharacterized membrane protein YgcG
MAETKVVNLEVKTNVEPLKKQLREAQKEVEALSEKFGATSIQAINAAKRAGELKDAIGDAKALTDSFNPDAKFNALSSSLGGVASGFAAYQGAMGLVGVESKELEAQLLKVQSAMAISQGLQGLGESIDSFKQLGAVIKNSVVTAFSSLKSALITSGIGLLVIAVGVLIANFDKLKNIVASNTAAAQKFVDSTKLQGDAARKTAGDFAEYERTLKRLGFTEDEIRKKRGGKLKDAISDTEREIAANKKLYKEQLKNLETVQSFDKFGLNATGRALYGSEEDAKKTRENIGGLRDELTKLKNDLFEFDNQQKKEAEKEDPVVKKYKKRIEVIKEHEEIKFNEVEFEKYWNGELQKITDLEQAKKDAQIEKEKEDIEMLSSFQIGIWEYEAKKQKEIDDKALADKKIIQNQQLKAVQDTFTIIANLSELFAGKSRKQQETAFKIQKAANIANATIDTYKAVMSTVASTPGGPVIKGIAGGVVLTAGLLNVKKIASTQFSSGGGSSGGGGGSTPSGGGGGNNAQIQAPSFNIVGNNGLNQLSQLKQAPIQAYVVSGAMSTAQSLDRNRVRNATL